jgi:hypothetical protein
LDLAVTQIHACCATTHAPADRVERAAGCDEAKVVQALGSAKALRKSSIPRLARLMNLHWLEVDVVAAAAETAA